MSDEYPDTPEKLQDFADDLGRTISKAQSELAASVCSASEQAFAEQFGPRQITSGYGSGLTQHKHEQRLRWVAWQAGAEWGARNLPNTKPTDSREE